MMKSNILLTLLATLVMVNVSRMGAQEITPQVQIAIGPTTGGRFNWPLQGLSRVLQREKKASLFRLTWDFAQADWAVKYTALYDREAQTMKVYYWGYVDEDAVREHYLLREVSPEIIKRASREFPNSGGGASDGYMDSLYRQYGCPKQELH